MSVAASHRHATGGRLPVFGAVPVGSAAISFCSSRFLRADHRFFPLWSRVVITDDRAEPHAGRHELGDGRQRRARATVGVDILLALFTLLVVIVLGNIQACRGDLAACRSALDRRPADRRMLVVGQAGLSRRWAAARIFAIPTPLAFRPQVSLLARVLSMTIVVSSSSRSAADILAVGEIVDRSTAAASATACAPAMGSSIVAPSSSGFTRAPSPRTSGSWRSPA